MYHRANDCNLEWISTVAAAADAHGLKVAALPLPPLPSTLSSLG